MVSKTSRQKEEYWVTCGEEVLPKDSRVMMIQKVFDPESIKPAWVAWVEILKRIEEQPYHWAVGRTRFQKIAYFASEQGLPLGLDYQKGSYGPFSPSLKALATCWGSQKVPPIRPVSVLSGDCSQLTKHGGK